MNFSKRVETAAVYAALSGLVLGLTGGLCAIAQQPGKPAVASLTLPASEASEIALPLPEDRGQAALEQALRRLRTTASVLVIVAHPDDEDGALLTYLSRGMGARCTLLTLTRGEGGQNAMGGESYDALGLIRTNELLRADQFYGVKQLWGTEADFGFSKTQEEAFARWGHERVLYDAVLAVRRERPQVIVSTFVGGVTDGHGHHQVSGEIAQEVFHAAADPKVFPEQLKDGLQPWQPLAVYSMVPFARIEDGKMFDYATGKWAPARFHNYVTGQWTNDEPSADVTIPVGKWDPVLGRSYVQIAREGWGEQKSQYGGASPALSGPVTTSYHLWAVADQASSLSHPSAMKPQKDGAREVVGADKRKNDSLFDNRTVRIDTGIEGLAGLVKGTPPAWLVSGLRQIGAGLDQFETKGQRQIGTAAAHQLSPVYKAALELRGKVAASDLTAEAKAGLLLELDAKIEQFQSVLTQLLGLDMEAFAARSGGGSGGGPGGRGGSADEMARSVIPGEQFRVRVHTAQATGESRLERVWLESSSGAAWKSDASAAKPNPAAPVADHVFAVRAAENAEPTQPYFSRPSIEQPFYDISQPQLRERSFAPYPLAAWTEFSFDGLPIRIGQVVQTMARVPGRGGIYEPLVVTPAIGISMEPEARILPLTGSAVSVKVMIHAQAAAEGTVDLQLPAGWVADPATASFHLKSGGDSEPIIFSVSTDGAQTGTFKIEAVAHSGGRDFRTGWQTIGYPGLRPYNLYKPAELKARKMDVKIAPGLRVGYVMGTGDPVFEAMEEIGAKPHLLSPAEVSSADLSAWNVLVIGIRAYSMRPELAAAEPRLEAFVRQGGTLIVQYQSDNFPAPLPLNMGRTGERVVDEATPVKILQPADPLLTAPNAINPADFDGWVEERGHGFLESWDPGYTALTETADAGQDPQRSGLLVAHPGKGTYVYVAFALHRQLPELVPGAYRLLANLLSAGRQ
jgi:LmbE family N-acetylglucosaminyl deacetylase